MFFHAHSDETLGGQLAAADVCAEAENAVSDIHALRQEVGRLFLLTEALWQLLKDQHGYTEEVLLRKVAEIDFRDGKLDGRVTHNQPLPCPKCHRPCGHEQTTCLFCGEELHRDLFSH